MAERSFGDDIAQRFTQRVFQIDREVPEENGAVGERQGLTRKACSGKRDRRDQESQAGGVDS